MVVDSSVRMLTESKHGYDTFTNIRYFNFYTSIVLGVPVYWTSCLQKEIQIWFFYKEAWHIKLLPCCFIIYNVPSCHYVIIFQRQTPSRHSLLFFPFADLQICNTLTGPMQYTHLVSTSQINKNRDETK
jgi:hypothetical protein